MDNPSAPGQIGCAEMVDDSVPSPGNPSAPTRPNPFDDEDLSARKRRRTSTSATPPPLPPLVSVEGPSASADNAPEQSAPLMHYQRQQHVASTSPVIEAEDTEGRNSADAPQTPPTANGSSPKEVATPVSSSKVTINLKRAQEIAVLPQEPTASPISVSRNSCSPPDLDAIRDNHSAMDVGEETPPDMPASASAHAAASPSAPTSLRAELAVLPDDGDNDQGDVEEVGGSGDSMALSGDETAFITLQDDVPTDPTSLFPYVEIDETSFEPLQRLIQYFLSDNPIESNVLSEIRKWIREYLHFARLAPVSTVLESRRAHCRIWHALPDAISALSSQRSELAKLRMLRDQAIGLFADFASLSSYMASLDFAEMQKQTIAGEAELRQVPEPELYSPRYLQRLHEILLPSSLLQARYYGDAETMERFDHDLEVQALESLTTSQDDILDTLMQLALSFKSYALLYPKMPERLAPLAYVVSDYLRTATRAAESAAESNTPLEEQAQLQLQMGDLLWGVMSSAFDLVVEKRCSQITPEAVPMVIDALTDLLKCSLLGNHPQALTRQREIQENFPSLPVQYHLDAICWHWRVDWLYLLVRSSQMHLRVMAANTLCGELIALWRAYKARDDADSTFLEHIGAYLMHIGLVDYILDANCHPEIIVESANILGFLAVTKQYCKAHTDRFWNCITSSQDPRVSGALDRMIKSILNLFDDSVLIDLCEKLYHQPLETITSHMRLVWDAVMNEIIKRCSSDGRLPPLRIFHLCLRLLRESSVMTPSNYLPAGEINQAAARHLKELFIYGPLEEERSVLLISCIDDIANKTPTTLGSLCCLTLLMGPIASKQRELIEDLTKRFDLSELIVQEVAHAADVRRDTHSAAVLSGDRNRPRQQLLTMLVLHSPDSLRRETAMDLLENLVGTKSTCEEDRGWGWDLLLSVMKQTSLQNSFLQTCLTAHLPTLPARYMSAGMLEFILERVRKGAIEAADFAIEDPDALENSGIKQLWTFALETPNHLQAEKAVASIAVDVYLESRVIRSCSPLRSSNIHALLVQRCLKQMRDAAFKLRGVGEATASDEDDSMVIVATGEELSKAGRTFSRSLQLLRLFIEQHQQRPHFAMADLRPLMARLPGPIKGESAELKYQQFDGNSQTPVDVLPAGRQNTMSSLLATVRDTTGFENFRLFFGGRQLFPRANEAARSLESLKILEGLLIVKREGNTSGPITRMKPGCSRLEIDILSEFEDLWDYLSLEDDKSQEMYDFLVQLPISGRHVALFESDLTTFTDITHEGEPFKTLYTIHAAGEYIDTSEAKMFLHREDSLDTQTTLQGYTCSVTRLLTLFVQAVSMAKVFGASSSSVHLSLTGALWKLFVKLFSKILAAPAKMELRADMMPSPKQVTKVLSFACEQSGDTSVELVESVFSAVLKISATSPDFGLGVLSDPNFMHSFRHILLEDPRKVVRHTTMKLIEEYCEMYELSKESQEDVDSARWILAVAKQLCLIAIGFTSRSVSYPLQCEDFFGSLQCLLSRVLQEDPDAMDISDFVTEAGGLLLDHRPTEHILHPGAVDQVARGLVSTLHLCLRLGKAILQSDAFSRTGSLDLLWKLLFPRKPRRDAVSDRPSVILNADTRDKLCDIVFEFAQKGDTELQHILELAVKLVPFFPEAPDDPYLYDLPNAFDRTSALRAKCGYVGLKNLSNTCYLNSLLTQLFMNVQFRSFIMSLHTDPTSDHSQLLFYIQQLFAFMQESYEKFVDPTSVVAAIKTYEDAPIDIHNQMDVDEFYNLLFDRLESQMHVTEDKQRLRSFFGGQLVQQVKSKQCEHISERLEPFSAIQCDIKGKATLQESLQAYVDGEVMEGENKYKCTSCDRHVDAVKRACLKDVPDNVIFHLKRFDFCLRTLQRSKINDHFSFPQKLDLAPYTIDSLTSEAKEKQPDEFELVGILVHAGGAESGHYYSYIRERSGSVEASWVEYNDDTVSPWDPSLMESKTFGGSESTAENEASALGFEKSYSAYMLFYQRASTFHTRMADTALHAAEPKMPSRLMGHIMGENTLLLKRHCLFDTSHSSLVHRLFQHATSKCGGSHDDGRNDATATAPDHVAQDLAMDLALLQLDQVVSRTKAGPAVEQFRSMVQAAVTSCADCARSCFDCLVERAAMVRSLIYRNPDQRVKAFAGQVLVLSYENLRLDGSDADTRDSFSSRASDGETGMETDDESTTDEEVHRTMTKLSQAQKLIVIFEHLWKFFPTHPRSWDEQFYAMLAFARQGSLETEHVLSANYLVKLMYMVMADARLEMPPCYHKMLNALTRRLNAGLPSYAGILELIDHLLGKMQPLLSSEAISETPRDRKGKGDKFMWTSREVETILLHPDAHKSSFFVEKLLEIGQCPDVVNCIIDKLVATGDEMDVRVQGALRKRLRGETVESFEAALSAAGQYLQSSTSTERVQAIIRYACNLASTLQYQEGLAFLKFMKLVLHPPTQDAARAGAIRLCGLDTMPTWAPHLLVYRDPSTRTAAEELIRDDLFPGDGTHAYASHNSQQETEEEAHSRAEVIQRLGIKCLEHLRDTHILGRTPIERGAATCISQMIDDCSTLFRIGDGSEDSDDAKAAYEVVRADIMEAVQRVTVDEVEDDMSDWDGSFVSSEMMELNVAVQATMDEMNKNGQ